MREQSKQILDQEHNTKLELRLSQAESSSLLRLERREEEREDPDEERM